MKRKRQPRPLKIYVTPGLVDDIGKTLHFALMGMQHGSPNITNWRSIAKVLLMVSAASDGNERIEPHDKAAIDNSVLVLAEISNRALDTDDWSATVSELPALARGILAAETALARIDYRSLASAYRLTSLTLGAI